MSSTSENSSLINIQQLMDLLQNERIVEYHNISESTAKEFLEPADCKNLKIIMPDCAIFVSTLTYPTIAMEIAYTETYEDLKENARLLLEGTAGEISVAILVKIVPLRSDESHIQSAFVQLYEYSSTQNRAIPRGGRKTLFPVPNNHARQRIEFSWEDVLKSQLPQIQPVSATPPPLLLDDLREIIDAYTERHIRLRDVEERLN
ncbi:conserved hypothetical protein [Histoplasma capsulatum G186AR]|uniref:Uncharacterized protein n=1 Tax=Ajellomyces capsulatus (strain G186AR / H82 / ATCC MYA-2454 / RMSCC 2432) TaxID=447093 RepID=C0NN29_AJECG|nr:uncharacterized protein HCBG_04156 [Histoplasma capsulatum G186AR]EEH07277.1 conserved hypothetical protein [Histoplasma capsulatum G186AR]